MSNENQVTEDESDESRFLRGFRKASIADLEKVVRRALVLEKHTYAGRDTASSLYRLRKSLEGIWGHELPELKE